MKLRRHQEPVHFVIHDCRILPGVTLPIDDRMNVHVVMKVGMRDFVNVILLVQAFRVILLHAELAWKDT